MLADRAHQGEAIFKAEFAESSSKKVPPMPRGSFTMFQEEILVALLLEARVELRPETMRGELRLRASEWHPRRSHSRA